MPDRLINVLPGPTSETTDPIEEAIRYEAKGVFAFAVVTAAAAALFAGQAIARQSRREWTDAATLRALGLSDREAGLAAALRGVVTGGLAALLAGLVSIAMTTVDAGGLAGRAELERGPFIDPTVLLVGMAAVLVVGTGATWLPVALMRTSPRRDRTTGRSVLPIESILPPSGVAGVSLTRSRAGGAADLPTGTALLGVAVALTAAVAAIGVTSSLDMLTGSPERFGAPWDVTFGPTTSDGPPVDALRFVATSDAVVAAAGIRAELERLAPGTVDGPVEQGAIRNVARIRSVPLLLAALLAVLAAASLAHALLLSVRRQRSQLAALKALGFHRRQVGAVVAWQATLLVGIATLVGVPLGIVVGRVGWRLVADSIGVASAPATPLQKLLLAGAGAIGAALVVAVYPAWRAARVPTAHALRVE